ncbi:TPA: hypothetical protein IAA68_03310 [Candidatus Galligastranaerophilus faecipullorum]|nr:hypothetical protein [Candidatus Galligastranaerophilus faecipullorum]
MKIEHLTSHLNFNSSPHMKRTGNRPSKNLDYGAEYKGANITTDKNRPAKSVNFSGSASLDTQKIINNALQELIQEGGKDFKGVKNAPEWAVKFLKSEKVNNALKLVKDNEALFENIITIFLAGLLKPICVLAMPGAEEEDKQMAATKNFVAAVTGFVLSSIILTPISKSVKKVTKNMAKFKINPEYAKLIDPKWEDIVVGKTKDGKDIMGGYLADAYSTFYKKVADLAITPTKAAITIAFMPYLLNFLFGKKNAAKKAEKEAKINEIIQQHSQLKLNENEQVFKQFAGGAIK